MFGMQTVNQQHIPKGRFITFRNSKSGSDFSTHFTCEKQQNVIHTHKLSVTACTSEAISTAKTHHITLLQYFWLCYLFLTRHCHFPFYTKPKPSWPDPPSLSFFEDIAKAAKYIYKREREKKDPHFPFSFHAQFPEGR